MNAPIPVLRIKIKELVIEIEDERAVQQLGASLGALLGQVGSTPPEEVLLVTDAPRKRRGRPRKAESVAKTGKRQKRRPRSDAATARIRQLGTEGFFDTPRRAAEVKAALAAGGYELENRQIYATLKYMADKGILQRSQESDDANWTYQMAGGD